MDACINDIDGDGICDELEIEGCTEITACNYNPYVTEDDGSCENTHHVMVVLMQMHVTITQ